MSFSFVAQAQTSDLRTVAEKSGWLKTGRAEETASLCKGFARKYPKRVRCRVFGVTPEGRELHALVVTDGTKQAPVVWVQAGIHAGEIDGKDATFWLLREALEGKLTPDPLKGLTLVFVPIFNLDGHERFGKWNRPNQVGPEEMGWRVTAQNLNLNRDFLKAEAPEMQALLKLWAEMDPALSLDLHVTDGAQFQPEVGLIIYPNDGEGKNALVDAGMKLEKELMTQLKARGRKALPFYPSFEKDDVPGSGFARGVNPPRFAHSYWAARNRLGILVESHSWKDYPTRVQTHRAVVLSALELAQKDAKSWVEAGRALQKESLAGKSVDLQWENTDKSTTMEFEGYKYEIKKSQISGGDVIKYFPDKPEIWKVPFFAELKPSLTVNAPTEGYLVPASEAAWLKPKLLVHGIKFETWRKPLPETLQVFRATKTEFGKSSSEGRQTLKVTGEWKAEKVALMPGALFVPIRQKEARLVLHIFEPQAADSFVSWGYFNRHFERKEYMEDYVAEDVATEMLAKDPAVKAEFEAKLKEPEFAKDPDARFQFFYRKHPSWDERFNRYPVFKL